MEEKPRPIPPAPPPAEMLRPAAAPHVPLTPMMDFLQRRLETLERELERERMRASSAQQALSAQDQLRSEVEANLKTLHEQIRREKSERESDEMRSHARGRIDVLEQRLDEMHHTWAELLKEAVSGRDAGAVEGRAASQAASQELARLSEAVNSLSSQLPELRSLVGQVPAEERKGFGQVADKLSSIAVSLEERLALLERRAAADGDKLDTRVIELTRERASLMESLQERDQAARREWMKERFLRENQITEQVGELCKRLDDLATHSGAARADLGKVLSILLTPPKAKDAIITELEHEKEELLRALRDRAETLQKSMAARQELERTLGDSLQEAHSRLDAEREQTRQAERRAADALADVQQLRDKLEAAARVSGDKDARMESLLAERDALTRSLVSEAARLRDAIEARSKVEEDWAKRLAALQASAEGSMAARAQAELMTAELQSQLTVVSSQLAKTLQEKQGSAGGESERQALLKRLREKDDMISMLTQSFQSALKKS